ncbi:MAG: FHA domain-containing protein, partial [Ilumatobacteraceae bacterium]
MDLDLPTRAAPDPLALSTHSAHSWACTWQTGPDAGGTTRLGVGRHLVGRARTAALRCDDPGLEPHHALLEVAADGSLELTQLTGRVPLLVALDDGPACAIEGPTPLTADGHGRTITIEIGGSTLVLRRLEATDPPHVAPAHLRQGALVRAPRAIPEWQPAALTPPEPAPRSPDRSGGLLPALLGLAGAGAIALVLRQPMFLLFGALGGLVAVGSWAAQR